MSGFGRLGRNFGRFGARVFGVTTGAGTTATLTDHAFSSADATSYTFSGKSLGTASASRVIVVFVAGRASLNPTISSVTVGGVTATAISEFSFTSGSLAHVGMFKASVPTGTTGDVVVTFAVTSLRCGIVIWALPTATKFAATTSTSSPATASPTLTAGASLLAASFGCDASTARTATWTGVTEGVDETIEGGMTQTAATLSASTGGAVTATCTYSTTPSLGAGSIFIVAS